MTTAADPTKDGAPDGGRGKARGKARPDAAAKDEAKLRKWRGVAAPGVDESVAPITLRYHPDANFGDALSPLIVSWMARRPVRRGPAQSADIVALGSILDGHSRHFADGGETRPYVWGTGLMKPQPNHFVDHVRICAVRGPLTATILGLPREVPLGDPGLLVSDLLAERPQRTDRIGIILHHNVAEDPAVQAAIAVIPEAEIIDVRTHDALGVSARIGACRYVLSSSLHGIIVADALGVPNSWLNPYKIHHYPENKFYDYALGIGRTLGTPVDVADIGAHLRGPLPESLPYAEGVDRSREALRTAFPEELIAA